MDFKTITYPVASDFATMDQFLVDCLRTHVPLVDEVGRYIISSGGKRLRPLVCLLAARATGYTGDRHVQLAALVELLHTATLLHDDVVDESKLRRGRQTVNAVWGNATSVLVGDFLISRAFQLIVDLGDPLLMKIMAEGTCIISEGEVMQLVNCRDPGTTEERYMQVIHGKTAKMFEAAAEMGAAMGNRELVDDFALYGRHLGAAFQIIDDVLDYTSSAEAMGKNVGDDLAEGKPTLPLIQAMKVAPAADAELIRQAIRTGGLEHLHEIIAIVQHSGALDYTLAKARSESELALAALAKAPESPHRESLVQLTQLALNRTA